MSCNNETHDICVNQYASYGFTMNFTDATGSFLDISDWQISGSIKKSYKEATSLQSFGVTILSLPSASVNLYLTPDQTATLTKSQYYYDVIAHVTGSSPSQTVRLLEGSVLMDSGVTQEG